MQLKSRHEPASQLGNRYRPQRDSKHQLVFFGTVGYRLVGSRLQLCVAKIPNQKVQKLFYEKCHEEMTGRKKQSKETYFPSLLSTDREAKQVAWMGVIFSFEANKTSSMSLNGLRHTPFNTVQLHGSNNSTIL